MGLKGLDRVDLRTLESRAQRLTLGHLVVDAVREGSKQPLVRRRHAVVEARSRRISVEGAHAKVIGDEAPVDGAGVFRRRRDGEKLGEPTLHAKTANLKPERAGPRPGQSLGRTSRPRGWRR